MKKLRIPRCACGRDKGTDGTCPLGCDKFRKPFSRYQVKATKEDRLGYLTRAEASEGAAKAMERRRHA